MWEQDARHNVGNTFTAAVASVEKKMREDAAMQRGIKNTHTHTKNKKNNNTIGKRA